MSRAAGMATVAVGLSLLFVGGMLYVLFRPQTLLLFHVADALGMTGVIGQWRLSASPYQPPEFVVYSLPAGLWAMSYVLIVGTLTQPLPQSSRRVATTFVPALGAASEMMQAAGLLPGTFDVADLVLYVVPLALYYAIESKTDKHYGKFFH